jgi:hypothetical protein
MQHIEKWIDKRKLVARVSPRGIRRIRLALAAGSD